VFLIKILQQAIYSAKMFEALKKENAWLKARIAALEALVSAVEYGDWCIWCGDVNGKNWFDVRKDLIGQCPKKGVDTC
jgi:hypothetical protein